MKHIPADKYNIAWFKLAEFVTRKEKERALGIYRLLSHSLHNQALSAQLEGDILLAFHDERALECYTKAAHLYQESNQLSQAAVLLEHVAYISANYLHYAPLLVEMYTALLNQPKMVHYTACYIEELLKNAHLEQATTFAQEISTKLDTTHTTMLFEALAITYSRQSQEFEEKAKFYIEHVLASTPTNSYQLHRFLTLLQETNSTCYTFALTCLTR